MLEIDETPTLDELLTVLEKHNVEEYRNDGDGFRVKFRATAENVTQSGKVPVLGPDGRELTREEIEELEKQQEEAVLFHSAE